MHLAIGDDRVRVPPQRAPDVLALIALGLERIDSGRVRLAGDADAAASSTGAADDDQRDGEHPPFDDAPPHARIVPAAAPGAHTRGRPVPRRARTVSILENLGATLPAMVYACGQKRRLPLPNSVISPLTIR